MKFQKNNPVLRSAFLAVFCFAFLSLCDGQTDKVTHSMNRGQNIPSNIKALIERTLSQPYQNLNTDWFGTIQAEALLAWSERGFPEGKDYVTHWLRYHIEHDSKAADNENFGSYEGPRGRVIRNGPLPVSVYAGTLGVAFPCYSLYRMTGETDAREVCISVADIVLHYSARDRFGYMAHDDNSYCKWCIPDVGYFAVRSLADASELVDQMTRKVYLKDAIHQAKMSVMLFYDKDMMLTRTLYNLAENKPGKTYWCRASGWMVYTLTALLRHSWDHSNLAEMPFEEAKKDILKCLSYFEENLNGFDATKAVYNFAYNASTQELISYLLTKVRAVRTGGWLIAGEKKLNPLPSPGPLVIGCWSHGPDNADAWVETEVTEFIASKGGWLVLNLHGLDEEGWGPVSSSYLDALLERIVKISYIDILPTGLAIEKYS